MTCNNKTFINTWFCDTKVEKIALTIYLSPRDRWVYLFSLNSLFYLFTFISFEKILVVCIHTSGYMYKKIKKMKK